MIGKIGQSKAVEKKQGTDNGRDMAQKVARTPRPEYRLGGTPAKNGANIGALPLLHQHQGYQHDTQQNLDHHQRGIHALSSSTIGFCGAANLQELSRLQGCPPNQPAINIGLGEK